MTEAELLELIRQAATFKSQDLKLIGNGLTSLPREIGQLTNLQRLDLSGNGLTSLPGGP